jgi:predicted AlkP superfamily phosphohydrolase/phosphomutase
VEHLRASHDEEMGEMIDVVNDLKLKEDELATVHRDLANQNNKIQELCKQLLSQEQSHKVRFFLNKALLWINEILPLIKCPYSCTIKTCILVTHCNQIMVVSVSYRK